ncbi:uncharacterized protein At2g39795, mitochondrial-like [Rhododendron vialii]|uniref:uncharacterized protein At2g39795, mitochondrial-like n=1 Tax=Rhododendron vialii TaxID=182163 RepID=UPI00265D6D30|nr:uncharacterized protein At2g39795, mitochondrial-like [Rhododendron vialii]
MAGLVQASRRSLLSPFRTLKLHLLHPNQQFSRQPYRPIPYFLTQTQTTTHLSTAALRKSPFESNILRILRNEIQYQSDYAPPHQSAMEFNAFVVEDRPSEQWITLRGKFGENETIKIEATMFDGSVVVPKSGDDGTAEDVRLHISLLVDISKGGECDLEFVCSSWPDHIEIQKVYIYRRDGSLKWPYMGPNFWDLDKKLQSALLDFLKARGVNNDLSVFLHEFMTNKDRTELIRWLAKIMSFVLE